MRVIEDFVKKSISFMVIWGSFGAFLTLYMLQKGCGLEGMESPFFMGMVDRALVYHTSLTRNIISFVFITIVFLIAWLTKARKNIGTPTFESWCIAILSLCIIVIKAHYSRPLDEWNGVLHQAWWIFIILAILAIPSMLFFLSWMQEKARGAWVGKMSRFLSGRVFLIICAILTFIGLGLDVYYSFSADIWNDEGYTMSVISEDWLDMISIAMKDVHPPFYLVVYKLSILLLPMLSTITAAKLAAVMPHLIMAMICLTIVRRRWGNFVAGMGAVAVVCMPYMLYSSQELRLYSWAMLWITCSWLFLHDVLTLNRLRDWVGFTACSVMTIYTYYSAGIAIGMMWLTLAVWAYRHRCMMRWWILLVVATLAYMPWLFVMMRQVLTVEKWYWMPPMTCLQFFELMLTPTRDVILIILVIAYARTCVKKMIHKQVSGRQAHALIGMSLVFVVVAVMCGLSYIGQPIITTCARYIVPMLSCLWLGFIIEANSKPKLRILAAAVILFTSVSELLSFAYVQREGAHGVKRLREFSCADESVVYVIPLPATGDFIENGIIPISAKGDFHGNSTALYYSTGEKMLYSLSACPYEEKISSNIEPTDIRIRKIIERYGLPSIITPIVSAYLHTICRKKYDKRSINIRAHGIKDLLKSGKSVYCIDFAYHGYVPDWDATEQLLASQGIRLDKEPSLSVKVNSGFYRVSLYKLEL